MYFAITILLLAGSTLAGFWSKYAWDEWGKLISSSTGKISGKILDEKKPYFINIGSNNIEVTVDELRKGINIGKLFNNSIKFDNGEIDLPIKMYEENNRLLFDMTILSKGKPVFTIIANEFEFNPDGKFDRNYNINGIEVIDENLIPQLQIYLKEGNKIYIGGSSKTDKHLYLFTHLGIFQTNPNELQTEHIKILFKYPSFKNLGVVEEKNLPDFSKMDAIILENENRKVKINEFSKLSNAELKSKALSLANSIDELQNKYPSKLPTEQAKQNDALDTLSEDNHKQLLIEYNSQYKAEVLAILQVIKSRLSPESSKELGDIDTIEWSAKSPYWFKKYISNSLRKAAILTP
jgi:hypothetical protein